MGGDFPQDVDKYDLIIHCGACMINKNLWIQSLSYAKKKYTYNQLWYTNLLFNRYIR